jgi:DNA-binding SARP family transcriptional activator
MCVASRDNQTVPAPDVLSPAALSALTDPAALLDRAWALEPSLRLAERWEALDRLEELLRSGTPIPAPTSRSWPLELLAERAIDAAANVRLEEATELADRVLDEAEPTHEIAVVRALMARGRALAWSGTDAATRRADRILADVAARCQALGHTEWHGFVLFWRGNAIYFQNGDLQRAAELMRDGLEVLGPDSPRRSVVLNFYADVLAAQGAWDLAEAALAEADELADRDEDLKARAYNAWTRARIASSRGDARATERLLREAEGDAADWFETHIGVTFLADAADMLDRVGLREPAGAYLARAATRDPTDEFVQQARATLLARSGDPFEALDALQQLVRGRWLEKRLIWHRTLLIAWATFRAGRRDAGELAARALEQASATGGIEVARAGEFELVGALLPLAERAGSVHARSLLLAERPLLVRLFGAPELVLGDGTTVAIPSGKPGELVRMLAVHEHGLPVELVLEAFFPSIAPTVARQRLRQILARLRSALGDVVLRDGERLRLIPAWVDVREFLAAAARARATRPPRSIRSAYAALALRSGPPLPADRYAAWAEEICEELESEYLGLLDLVAADAAARGSHQEALTALDAAREADPLDTERYLTIAELLLALGRRGAAEYLVHLARIGPEDPRAHFAA